MTPEQLATIHAAAFAHSRAWTVAEFETLLARPTSILIGERQSFVLARQILDEVEILTVATHPSAQNQGLARSNLLKLVETVGKNAATRVFLEVAEDNEAALSLYASLGFVQVALRTAYYQSKDGSALNALILEKKLT